MDSYWNVKHYSLREKDKNKNALIQYKNKKLVIIYERLDWCIHRLSTILMKSTNIVWQWIRKMNGNTDFFIHLFWSMTWMKICRVPLFHFVGQFLLNVKKQKGLPGFKKIQICYYLHHFIANWNDKHIGNSHFVFNLNVYQFVYKYTRNN